MKSTGSGGGGGGGVLTAGIIFFVVAFGIFFESKSQKGNPKPLRIEYEESEGGSGGVMPGGNSNTDPTNNLPPEPNTTDENGNPIYDPNMPGGPGGPGTGTDRNWRGYVQTDVEALRAQLPPQAQHLAESFVAAGQQYNIDPLFLASISYHETGGWTSAAFNDGRYNAMGISNNNGPIGFSSHHQSIMQQAASLAGAPGTNGYYNNAQTVGQVGQIYAPVGATNDPRGLNGYWPTTVGKIYDGYVGTLR